MSELALAGLAGIGMVLFFILIALLFGGWVEGKVTASTSQASLLMWLILVLCLVGMSALLWWSSRWPVLIGLALTGTISSSWLGFERARAITSGGSKYMINVTIDERVQGSLSLVGRLGDSYVLWDMARKTAVLVPAGDVSRLEIARKPVLPAKSAQPR
ncbi:TPA: hypothetical protein ACGRQA_004428 [Stenotrophomonas maltophilia]